MLRPSYAKVFVYSSVRRLRPGTIFCCLLAAEGSTNGGREETTSQRGWENDVELPHTFYGTKKGAISLVREIAPIVSFLLCKKA